MAAATIRESKKKTDQRIRETQQAAVLLKHASEPTRLRILLLLSEGELHVGALCDDLKQSQPAVSHHLALLRHGGIIAPRRQGKNNFYGLTESGEKLVFAAKGVF